MHVYKRLGYSAVTQLLYGLKQVILLCCPTQSLSLCNLSLKSKVCSLLLHQGAHLRQCQTEALFKSLTQTPFISVSPSLQSHSCHDLSCQVIFQPTLVVLSFTSLCFHFLQLSSPYLSSHCPIFPFLKLDLFPCFLFQAPALPLQGLFFHLLPKTVGRALCILVSHQQVLLHLPMPLPCFSSSHQHPGQHESHRLLQEKPCLRDNDNVIQRSYPVLQEWQKENFHMLVSSSNGINIFHLSAGVGPKEDHLCV